MGRSSLGKGDTLWRILKRFRMQDYRPMSTLMITNWRKIDASEGATVDPTLYRKRIGSLVCLDNRRPTICFRQHSHLIHGGT